MLAAGVVLPLRGVLGLISLFWAWLLGGRLSARVLGLSLALRSPPAQSSNRLA